MSNRFKALALAGSLAMVAGAVAPVAAQTDLTLWTAEGEAEGAFQYVEGLAAAYCEANPDVNITVVNKQVETLREDFLTSSLAGGAPDILWTVADHVGPFTASGTIAPLDGLIDTSVYLPNALEAVTIDGELWGVPASFGNHLMLYWNKDLVPEGPANSDEMIAIAQENTDAANNKYGLVFNQTESFWLVPFLGGFGGSVFAEDGVTPTLDTEAMVGALQFLHDLKYADGVMPAEADYNVADGLFSQGDAAMIVNGDWALGTYAETFGDSLGLGPIPEIVGDEWPKPYTAGKFLMVVQLTRLPTRPQRPSSVTSSSASPTPTTSSSPGRAAPAAAGNLEAINDPLVTEDALLAGSAGPSRSGIAQPTNLEMRCVFDSMTAGVRNLFANECHPTRRPSRPTCRRPLTSAWHPEASAPPSEPDHRLSRWRGTPVSRLGSRYYLCNLPREWRRHVAREETMNELHRFIRLRTGLHGAERSRRLALLDHPRHRAMEAVLYLLLMARREDTRSSAIAIALPLVVVGLFLVYNNELTVDLLIQVVFALGVIGAILGASTGSWCAQRDESKRLALTTMLLAPAIVGIAILYVYPLYYEFSLSFTKMNIRNFVDPGLFFGLTMESTPLEPWGAEKDIFIGLQNYIDVFTKPVLKQTGFWQLLTQTLIWTVVCIFFHVMLGILLALMLNRKLRGRTHLPCPAHPALGHPGLHLAADLADRVQLPVRCREPGHRPLRHTAAAVAERPDHELPGHDHHQRLAGRAVHDGHHPRRPAVDLTGLLRGLGDRWRLRPPAVLQHHPAPAASGAHPGRPAGRVPHLQQHQRALLHQPERAGDQRHPRHRALSRGLQVQSLRIRGRLRLRHLRHPAGLHHLVREADRAS